MIDEAKVYTVEDIQKMLRINRSMAYELVKSGKFLSKRIGHRILIPRKTFLEWLYSMSD